MGEHRLGDLHPLFGADQLVGGEGDGEAIEQVIADGSLLRVVGGDQQGPAGMRKAEAFTFHLVVATAHGRQHQVDDAVVEQVELIHVQHPTVRFGEQARLEHGTAAGEGGGHIHRSHEAVFGDAQGNLHERGGQHPGGQLRLQVLSRGITCECGDALADHVVPFFRALGVKIAAGGAVDVEHVDRRQQGVQSAGQH